jgi:hypothetical protein
MPGVASDMSHSHRGANGTSRKRGSGCRRKELEGQEPTSAQAIAVCDDRSSHALKIGRRQAVPRLTFDDKAIQSTIMPNQKLMADHATAPNNLTIKDTSFRFDSIR